MRQIVGYFIRYVEKKITLLHLEIKLVQFVLLCAK